MADAAAPIDLFRLATYPAEAAVWLAAEASRGRHARQRRGTAQADDGRAGQGRPGQAVAAIRQVDDVRRDPRSGGPGRAKPERYPAPGDGEVGAGGAQRHARAAA